MTPSWSRIALTILAVGAATIVVSFALLLFAVRSEGRRMQELTRGDLDLLVPALERFDADCGRYPSASEGLKALSNKPLQLASSWRGPYLDREIVNDPWGQPYLYQPGPEDGYTVTSCGADALPGGEGQDADLVLSH